MSLSVSEVKEPTCVPEKKYLREASCTSTRLRMAEPVYINYHVLPSPLSRFSTPTDYPIPPDYSSLSTFDSLMSSKRGRKRNDNLPPNRARDVQRAFRARRAAHLQVRNSSLNLLVVLKNTPRPLKSAYTRLKKRMIACAQRLISHRRLDHCSGEDLPARINQSR